MIFKKSQTGDDSQSRDRGGFDRKMYQGDWKCVDCGTEITELPFEPDPDRPIYCRDCWRKRREHSRQ